MDNILGRFMSSSWLIISWTMVLVQSSFHTTWATLFEMELELTRMKWKWTITQTRTRGHETHHYKFHRTKRWATVFRHKLLIPAIVGRSASRKYSTVINVIQPLSLVLDWRLANFFSNEYSHYFGILLDFSFFCNENWHNWTTFEQKSSENWY